MVNKSFALLMFLHRLLGHGTHTSRTTSSSFRK
uniref:Uncharacterized protein n=1 Tax=Arundo donax TaxID=35708 RepID=A0A0A9C5S5_ARUDO